MSDHDEDFFPTIKCIECGEKCGTCEETFDFSGTHCTSGRGGTHHTGIYVSDCCLADYEAIQDLEDNDNE